MQAEAIAKLSANIRGRVIDPDSSEYEVARKVYNGMINRHPTAIVRCANVEDVIATVNFARQERLTVAIRGGGHNGAGFGVCDDGLVLDLSAMKGVTVDSASRTVRVGPGFEDRPVNEHRKPLGIETHPILAGCRLKPSNFSYLPVDSDQQKNRSSFPAYAKRPAPCCSSAGR